MSSSCEPSQNPFRTLSVRSPKEEARDDKWMRVTHFQMPVDPGQFCSVRPVPVTPPASLAGLITEREESVLNTCLEIPLPSHKLVLLNVMCRFAFPAEPLPIDDRQWPMSTVQVYQFPQ